MWWLVFLLLPGAGAFCEVPNATDTFEVHRLVERAQMMQGKWHIIDALENYDWWYSSLWEGVGFPAADDPSPHLERLSGVESAYDAFTLTRARFPTQEAGNVHCARTCDDLCTGDCFVRGTALVPIRYYGLDFAAPPRAGDASYRLLLGPTVYTVQVRWNFTAPGAAVALAPRVWSLDLPYAGGVRLLFNAVTGAGTLYAAPRAFRNYLVGQALADVHLFRGGTCGDDASATCPGSMTTYNVPCAGRGRCESTCECVCDKAPQEMLQEALVVGASAPNTPDGTLTVQDSPTRTPYRGAGCELTCPGYDGFSMESVCSGRGTCSDRGVCICDYGYIGDNCQFKCPGFDEQNAEESAQRICSKRGSCQVTDIAASSFRSADVRNRDRFFRALREFYGRCHTFIADNQVTDATKFPGEACASDEECASLHCASGACEGAEPVHSFVELALDVGTLANGTFHAAQATPSLHPRRACGRLDDCVAYDAGGIYRGAQLRVRAGSAVRAFRDPFASAVRTVDGDSLAHLMKGRASDLDYCLVPSQQRAEQPWVYRPMVRGFVQIYDEAVAPQQWEGLLTRTAPTSVADDDPPRLVATRDCEVHPDFTLRCPSCMCFRSRVQGFFDGPNCDACERGYATSTCKTKCPGYDGKNIETACSGLGLCNMGIGGTGECLCGGSGGARSTADTGRELTVYRDVDASYGGGTAAYCAVWRTQDLCDKEMGCLWTSRCVPRRSGGDRAVLAPPLPPFEATYYVGRYREFSTFLWPTASTDTIIDLVNWDNGTTTNEAGEAQCVDFPGVSCDPDASHVFFYAGTTQPAGAKTTKQLCPKDSVDLDVLRTVAAYETPYHAWSDVFKACCRCGGGQRAHGLPTSALKVASSYESDCEDTWKRDCDSFPHCRDGRVDTAAPIDWISFRDRLGVTPDVGCCRCGGGASTARAAPCEVPSFARSDDRRCVGATPAGERCDGSYGSATVFEAPYRAYEAAVCDDPLTHVLPYDKTFTLQEGAYECTNFVATYAYRVFSGAAGLQECRDHCAADESCTAFTRDGTACHIFLGCDLVAGGAGQTWTRGPASLVYVHPAPCLALEHMPDGSGCGAHPRAPGPLLAFNDTTVLAPAGSHADLGIATRVSLVRVYAQESPFATAPAADTSVYVDGTLCGVVPAAATGWTDVACDLEGTTVRLTHFSFSEVRVFYDDTQLEGVATQTSTLGARDAVLTDLWSGPAELLTYTVGAFASSTAWLTVDLGRALAVTRVQLQVDPAYFQYVQMLISQDATPGTGAVCMDRVSGYATGRVALPTDVEVLFPGSPPPATQLDFVCDDPRLFGRYFHVTSLSASEIRAAGLVITAEETFYAGRARDGAVETQPLPADPVGAEWTLTLAPVIFGNQSNATLGRACNNFGCGPVTARNGSSPADARTPATPTLFSEAFDGALGDAVISVATAAVEACDGHHVSSLYCAEYARVRSLPYAPAASGRPNGCSYDAEGVYYRVPNASSAPVTPSTSLCRSVLPETFATLEAAQAACESSGRCRGVSKQQSTYHLRTGSLLEPFTPVPFVAVDRHPVGSVAADLGCVNDVATLEDAVDMCAADPTCALFWRYSRFDSAAGRTCFKQSMAPYELDTRSNAAWSTITTGETYIYDMPEQSWLYLGVRDVRDCRDACDALETCGEYYEADGACILADGACLAAVGSMAHYKQDHATSQACGATFPECLAYEGPRGLGVCNGSRTEAQCEEECALDLGCAGYEWDGAVCRLTRVLTEDATAAPGTYCARKENHARCAGWGCADVGGVNCSACTNPGARAGCCSCGGGEASNAPEVEFSVRPNPVSTRGSYPVSVSQVERRTASRINFPFEFAGVTTIRTRRRASSSTCPDCPDSDCSRCPNDCRLCVGDFTGFNCADGCGTCVLGGTCVTEPTDGVSLCDCPSASSGPRQNCCPRGTLLLQNDQYVNSPNQVSGITAAVALFGSFSYQEDPRSRMFFRSNATAEQALVSGCYPCPGLAESADLCMHALCEDDLVSVPDRCRTAEEFRVGFANLWLTPPRRSFERVSGRGCSLLYRVAVFRTYREARLACVGTCAGIMESLAEVVYYTCSSVEDIHLVYSSNFNLWREVPLGVCPDATYADTAEMRHWKSIYAASSGFASNVCGGHLDQCMLDFNPSAGSVFRDKASCGACFTKDAVYPTLAHGDDCSVCGYGQFGVALDPTRDTYDTVCESCPAGRGVPGTVGVIQDYATYQNSTCSGARIVLESVVEVVEQLDADVVILGPGETSCPAGSATLFEHECQVYGTLVSGYGYGGERGSFPKDLLGCFISTHGDGTRSVLFNTAPSSNLGTIDNDRLLCLKLHNGTCSAARQKYDERSCERFARAWGYHYAVRFGSSGGCKLDAPRGLVTYHLAAGSAPSAMTTYRNGNGLVYQSDALYMLRPAETPFTFPSNDAIGNMSATSGDGTSGDTSSASQYGPDALYLGCQYCPDGASEWHPQGLVATFTDHQLYYNPGDGNWISWPTTHTGVKAVVRPDGRKLLLLTTSNQLLINQYAGNVLVELSGRFTYGSSFDSWETVATGVHDMDMSAGRPVYWDSNQNQQGDGPKQRIVIRNGAGDVLRAEHQFGAGTFTSLAAPVPMHRVAISSNARHIWATEATGELWHYDTGERIVYATASLEQVGAASGWQQVHLGVAVDRITAREDDELVVLTTTGGIYVYTVNGTLESVVSSDYVRLPASLVPPDYLNKTISNGIQISSTLTTGAAYLSRAAKDRSNEHVTYAFTDAGLPDVAPPDAWLSSRSTLAYVHDPHATYDYTHVQAMRYCTQQGLTLCTREALERWSDQTSTNVCKTGWFVDTSVPSWYVPVGEVSPGCGVEGWNYWQPESGLAAPHCCRVELNDPVSEHFMSGGNFYLSCPPSADLLLAPRGSCNNTVALFSAAACDTLGGVEVAGTCEMDLCAAGTYGFGGCDDGPEATLALAELDCPGVYADGVCTARVCERGAYRASTRCLSARQFDLGGVQFCDGHDSFARYCGADDPQPVCGDFHGSMDRCGAEHVSKTRCERHANELGYTFRTAQADNFALLAYALPVGCSVVHEQSLVVYRDIYGKMPTVNAIPYMDGESVRYGKVDGGDVNALDGSAWAVATGRFDSSVTDHTVTYSTSDGDLNAYNFEHFDSVPPFTYVLAQPMEFGANYWETTSSVNIGPGIIGMGGDGTVVTSYPTSTIYDPRAFVWPLRAAASVCTTPISPVRPRRFHVPRATAAGATPAEGYWLDQQNMCSARGLRLCRRDEMCPVLEQVAVDFDNWFAIDCEDGSTNCWTNNGNVWPGCVTHREAAGAKPEWTGAVSWLWHGFCCEDLDIGPVDGEYECTRDADCKCYTSDGFLYTGAEAIRDAVATTAHAKVGDHLAPGYKCAPAAEDWTCVGGSFSLVRRAATCADWGSHYVVSSSAVPATTYDECLAACYDEVLCDGFFWNGTSCYLSDGLCELGDGAQDYYARSVIPPVYYFAAEGTACDALETYGVAEEPATTVKTCENLCAATPLCREFFWNGRTCHMANGGCTEVGGEFHHYRRAEYELTAPLRVVGSQVECQSQDGANCLWGACPSPGTAADLTHPSFAPALDDAGAVHTGASWVDRAYRLLNGPLACEGPAAGCRTDFADGTCEARPQTLIVESLNDAARVNSSVSGGPCGACPAGRFNDGTSTVCQTCGRGKYQNEVGTRACKSCPYGWYTAKDTGPEGHDSFDDCTPCPDGHFMDTPRFSDENNCRECPVGYGNDIATRWYCRACPAGYFSFEQDLSWTAPTVAIAGSTCRACPPGRVQPLNSRSDCNLCLSSQYQDEFGQLNCKVCASGLTPSEDRTACQACLPGRFGVSGALECAACAPGTYTSEEGFSACKSCSPGQFVATVGATGCDLCAAGQSQHEAGQSACDSCAAGRFASAEGQTACDACPQGWSQAAGGQTACLACAAGRFQASTGATSCDTCTSGALDDDAVGTYQDQEGQASCKSCPAGLPFSVAPYTSSSNCQTCGAGTYISGAVCKACMVGMFQDEEGQNWCKECPPTAYTTAVGAASQYDCYTVIQANIDSRKTFTEHDVAREWGKSHEYARHKCFIEYSDWCLAYSWNPDDWTFWYDSNYQNPHYRGTYGQGWTSYYVASEP
jgi:hypothetical protein